MSKIYRFSCPACSAKMKAARLPTAAVNCPRCGKPFVPQAIEDPPAAEETYGFDEAPPGPAPVVAREPERAPAPSSSSAAAPKKKKKKKKQGFAALDPDTKQLILWVGGVAGVLLIGAAIWLGVVLSRKPLTLDEVAGEYLCDSDAKYRIKLAADGRCQLTDESAPQFFNPGYPFTIKGSTLAVGIDKEYDGVGINVEQGKVVGVNPVRIILNHFGDLTYSGDGIDSTTLGHFSRVKTPAVIAGQDKPAGGIDGGGAGQGAKAGQPASDDLGAATPVAMNALKPINRFVVSADGSTVAAMIGEGTVVTWDAATKKAFGAWDTHFDLSSVALSPDGKRVALGGGNAIRMMDSRTGAFLTKTAQSSGATYQNLTYIAGGLRLFGTDMRSASILDAETGQQIAHFEVSSSARSFDEGIRGYVMTEDGRTCIALTKNHGPVVMKGEDPTFLEWWNLETGAKDRTIDLPGCSRVQYGTLALSNDGKTLAIVESYPRRVPASPSRATEVLTWQVIDLRDAQTGAILRECPIEFTQPVNAMMFRVGDRSLVLAGNGRFGLKADAEILEWNLEGGFRLRSVDRDRDWGYFQLAQRPQLIVYPQEPDDFDKKVGVDTLPFQLIEMAKVAWKEEPESTANAERASNAKSGTQSVGEPEKELVNGLGMKLIALPRGEFETGLPVQYTGGTETTRLLVRMLHPPMIASTPVTVGQMAKFVDDSHYETTAEIAKLKETWRSPGFPQTDTHPVVCVSLRDAVAFCEWLSKKEGRHYRLPQEEEWEYACRAGTKTPFFFGAAESELKDFAWMAENGGKHTHPVGEKQANPWGMFDMLGNAQQLCADPYVPENGGVAARGGSWDSKPKACTVLAIAYCRAAESNPRTGFRVVLDLRESAR